MALVLVVLGLAACGGDDDPTLGGPTDNGTDAGDVDDGTAGGGREVTVLARDIEFDDVAYEAEPGSVTFVYENEGVLEHTLLIEEVEGFQLAVPSEGDVDEGTADLEPGTYTLYCDIAGHREAGMEATLEVG